MTDKYEIGYGKPPVATKWVKGQPSPNPKGRPKGSRNLYTLLNQLADEEVQVVQNGKTMKLPKKAVALLKAVNAACNGDTKALALLLPHFIQAEAKAVEQEAKIHALSTSDEAIISEFITRTKELNNVYKK